MTMTSSSMIALARLRGVGLRPTRQRVALARLLLENGDRHITAEQLHSEAVGAAIRVSLATVYNTLHQFTDAGLLREDVVVSGFPLPPLGTEICRVDVIIRVRPENC